MRNFFNYFKIHKITIIDGLFLFVLMIIFFSRWIFNERYILFALDIVQDFSMHHYAASVWRQGTIPLWDPYFTWAIVGYLNSGFFYPFNLLMDFLMGFSLNHFNLSYLLMEGNVFFHYFLASFFMYLTTRYFKLSRPASLLAAITFAYSGYLVKEYIHIYYLQGTVWLPLIFLFSYRSIFENLKYAVWAGIFLAISLLAGQTQPGVYCIFLLFTLTIWSVYTFFEEKGKIFLKPIVSIFIVGLISFGLFAIQFFPSIEYTKYSARNEIYYDYSVDYSAPPLYLIVHPFVPAFWGGMESKTWSGVDVNTLPFHGNPKWLDSFFGGLPNEMNFYLGLLPLFLLPFSFLSKNRFLKNFFLIILFLSILLMLSKSLPLIGQLWWNFLGGVARVPVRASVLWTFSIAFLAALGLQAIMDFREEKKKLLVKIAKMNFVLLAGLLFLILPLLVFLTLFGAGSNLMVYFYYPMVNVFSLFVVYFLIYSLLIFFLIRSQYYHAILFFILAFFIIDLFSFHFGNSFILAGNSPEHVLEKKFLPEVQHLINDKTYFRVHGLGLTAYANNLFSLGYGTAGLFGVAYRPTMELYGIISDDASPIYDLLNVKYIYNKEGKFSDLRSSISGSTFLSDHQPYDAFDNDEQTEWVADPKTSLLSGGDWLLINFRQPTIITRLEILGRDNGRDKEIRNIELVFSNGKTQKFALPVKEGWKTVLINSEKTDWVRIIIQGFDSDEGKNDFYGLKEIKVFDNGGNIALIGSPKLQKITDNLYLNKTVFPRVFTVENYRVFKDRDEMFAAILNDKTGEEMRKTVFLYENPIPFDKSKTAKNEESNVSITSFKPRKVVINADIKNNSFLVLGEIWFPGWKAYVDGKETKIYSAYQIYRAVEVPEGKHEIIFYYDPRSFKIGLIITIGTIILIFFYMSPLKKSLKTFFLEVRMK